MNRHVRPQTMSSREFNQNTGRAKQAADLGPLTITDRGEPAYVLMRYEDYEQLMPTDPPTRKRTLADLHDPRPEADFDFEFPRLDWKMREIDFNP